MVPKGYAISCIYIDVGGTLNFSIFMPKLCSGGFNQQTFKLVLLNIFFIFVITKSLLKKTPENMFNDLFYFLKAWIKM